MDKSTAIEVQRLLDKGGEHIRKSIDAVRGQLPDDAFHKYCGAVGTLLTDLKDGLLTPFIYTEYPDLAPKAPSDNASKELLTRLEPRFKEAAARARRETE